MNAPFTLDARLENDSLPLLQWPLCEVRLMNNARFPWLLLVPRKDGLREFTDLPTAEQTQLMQEITQASRVLQTLTGAEKMNIGALGNIVAQLHVHVIARFAADAAWPNPVWGTGGEPYSDSEATAWTKNLRAALDINAKNK